MNIFRLIGDLLHLVAIVILLHKMLKGRTAAGLSLKTQFCFAVVFATRYLDLFTSYISLYNTTMKIFFLATSFHICYLMRFKNPWRASYDRENDTFKLRYLFIPCAILALIFHRESLHLVQELLWTFSEYLEAVAILPQILLMEETERYDALTSHYLVCLGLYRVFYVFNWIYRYVETGRVLWISVVAGLLQSLLYADFFYRYFKQVVKKVNEKYDLANHNQ